MGPPFRYPMPLHAGSATAPSQNPTTRPNQIFIHTTNRARSWDEIESSPQSSPGSIRSCTGVDGVDDAGVVEFKLGRENKRRRLRQVADELEETQNACYDTLQDGIELSEAVVVETDEDNSQILADNSSLSSASPQGVHSAALRQPVFRPPPRFRMPNTDRVIFTEAPPPALTPQRRLAKYVPGGLATEVQGWLSHIKGSEVEDEGVTPFRIEEVQREGSTYLARVGSILSGGDDTVLEPRSTLQMVILAGRDEWIGLDRSPQLVRQSSVIRAEGPTWRVPLGELGNWLVFCDWTPL